MSTVHLAFEPQSTYDYQSGFGTAGGADWQSAELNVPLEQYKRRMYCSFGYQNDPAPHDWRIEAEIVFTRSGRVVGTIPYIRAGAAVAGIVQNFFPADNDVFAAQAFGSANAIVAYVGSGTPIERLIFPFEVTCACDKIYMSYQLRKGNSTGGFPYWYLGCMSIHLW